MKLDKKYHVNQVSLYFFLNQVKTTNLAIILIKLEQYSCSYQLYIIKKNKKPSPSAVVRVSAVYLHFTPHQTPLSIDIAPLGGAVDIRGFNPRTTISPSSDNWARIFWEQPLIYTHPRGLDVTVTPSQAQERPCISGLTRQFVPFLWPQ